MMLLTVFSPDELKSSLTSVSLPLGQAGRKVFALRNELALQPGLCFHEFNCTAVLSNMKLCRQSMHITSVAVRLIQPKV